jgi:transcriptional regulator with GAF, ATPase, and Fis domain
MDLFPVILSIAQAEGPPSVLGQTAGLQLAWQRERVAEPGRKSSDSRKGGTLHFDIGDRSSQKPLAAKHDRAAFYTEAEWIEKERENLLNALKHAGGKVSGAGGAAELLGVNANTLASRLRALGMSRNYSR